MEKAEQEKVSPPVEKRGSFTARLEPLLTGKTSPGTPPVEKRNSYTSRLEPLIISKASPGTPNLKVHSAYSSANENGSIELATVESTPMRRVSGSTVNDFDAHTPISSPKTDLSPSISIKNASSTNENGSIELRKLESTPMRRVSGSSLNEFDIQTATAGPRGDRRPSTNFKNSPSFGTRLADSQPGSFRRVSGNAVVAGLEKASFSPTRRESLNTPKRRTSNIVIDGVNQIVTTGNPVAGASPVSKKLSNRDLVASPEDRTGSIKRRSLIGASKGKGKGSPILTHDSLFFFIWNWIMVIVFLWYALTVPIRLVFWSATDLVLPTTWKFATTIIDLLFDILSLFDMPLRMLKFVTFHHNALIDNPRTIRDLYVRRHLLIDLIASVPLACLFRFMSNSYGASYLDILKFARYLRVSTYIRDIEAFLTSKKIFVSAAISRLGKNMIFIVVLTVTNGMIFYSISNNDSVATDTWRLKYITSSSVSERVLQSLYYLLQILFTIGYGDIPPVTDSEIILTCFYCICGSLSMGFLVGNMTSLFLNLDTTRSVFKSIIDDIEEYMQFRELPESLRQNVRQFCDDQWNSNKGKLEDDILSDLPQDLKESIIIRIRSIYLQKIQYFVNMKKPELFQELCKKMRSHTYVSGDYVVRKNTPIPEIFFVHSGEVHVLGGDMRSVVAKFKPGEYYGLHTLFNDEKICSNTFRAGTFVNLFVLNKLDILEVVKRPEFANTCQKVLNPDIESKEYQNIIADFDNLQLKWSSSEATLKKSVKLSKMTVGEGRKPEFWMIKAHGKFKMIWDSIMMAICIYFSFIISFRIGYAFSPYVIDLRVTAWIDFVLELFFLVDIFLIRAFVASGEKFSLYMNHLGEVDEPFDAIGAMFELRDNFSVKNVTLEVSILLFSILSVISAQGAFGDQKLYALLTIPLFSRALYASNEFTYIRDHMNINFEFRISDGILLACKLFYNLIVAIHIMSCTWLCVKPPAQIDADITEKLDFAGNYVKSIYFIMTTLATVGYGDIVPSDYNSYLFVILIIILGCTLYAGAVSYVTSLMTDTQVTENNLDHQETCVNAYLMDRSYSKELKDKVKNFFQFRLSSSGTVNEAAILSLLNGVRGRGKVNYLSESMRDAVIAHLTTPILNKCIFFKNSKVELLYALSRMLQKRMYCPGDIISNTSDRKFCLIFSGTAEEISQKKSVISNVRQGDCHGSLYLISNDLSEETLRAKTYCEIWFMYKNDCDFVLEAYTFFSKDVFEVMANKMKELSEPPNSEENNLLPVKKSKRKSVHDDDEITTLSSDRIPSESNIQYIWNIVVLVALMYNIIAFPYRLGFLVNIPADPVFVIDYICDIVFLVDSILRYWKFEYADSTSIISSSKDIKEHYKKNFLFKDVLSLLPIEVIVLTSLHYTIYPIIYSNIFQVCRINRLIRSYRMNEHVRILESRVGSKRENITIISRLVAAMLLSCHWAGCLFFWMANYSVNGASVPASELWYDKPNSDGLFAVSIYMATNTICTVGYGDYNPLTTLQRLFIILVFIIGGFVYSVVVGKISGVIAQADISSVLFQERMEHIKKYLTWRNIDSQTQYRIVCHLFELWMHQKGCDEDQLLQFLPVSLRADLVKEACEKMTAKIPIIKDWKDTQMIYEKLRAETYLIGEHIYDKGEIAIACYFLTSGAVEAMSDDGKTIFSTFTPGYTFGESAFLLREMHECSTRAKLISNCFKLVSDDFDVILSHDLVRKEQFNKLISTDGEMIRKQGSVTAKFTKNMSSKKISKLQTDDNVVETRKNYIIMPDSTFRRVWDSIQLIIVCYNAVVIPYQIALCLRDSFPNPIYTFPALWLNIFADLFTYTDVILSAAFFAMSVEGVYLVTHQEVLSAYVRTLMVLDMVSCFPLDYIGFGIFRGDNLKIYLIALLRLPRLFRLTRLNVYSESIKNALESRMIYINSSYRQLMVLIFLILIVSHFLGCFRVILLYSQGELADGYIATSLYVQNLYWTIYSLTTVGFGNVGCFTVIEKVYAICVIFIGTFLCDAGIVATLSNFVGIIDAQDAEVKRRKDCAYKYLSNWDLGNTLQDQVHLFFEYNSQAQDNIDEIAMLNIIPDHFLPELINQCSLKQADISKMVLLKNFNVGMMRSLVTAMKPRLFLPGMVILKAGVVPANLYLLVKGSVESLTPEEEEFENDMLLQNGIDLIDKPIFSSFENGGSSSITITSGFIGRDKFGQKASNTYRSNAVSETFFLPMKHYSAIMSAASAVGGLYNDFEDLLNDPVGVRHFLAYVESQFSSENLKFYLAIEKDYKTLADESKAMKKKAREIYDQYLHETSPQQINIKSAVRAAIDEVVEWGAITCFDDAKQEIYLLMKKDTLPRFLQSKNFQQLVEEKERKRRASKFSIGSTRDTKGDNDPEKRISSISSLTSIFV